MVDVQAIGCAANLDHLGTQFVEDLGRNMVGRTVSGIHDNTHALQGEVIGKGALAKLDITAGGVFQTAGFTQRCGVGPHRWLGDRGFHRQLPCIGQLGALGAKKLDSVVGKRVMAGADDHAQRSSLCAGQVGNAGGGQRAQQHHINTSRIEPAFQCALQHVAGDARVFAN